MAVMEGLGAIAGNFSEGYRQARAQKNQESLQQQQMQYEHASRLFQMADQVQDPKMKDTLFSSASQILDSIEKPQKKDPKGIGAILGGMFGIGHHAPMSTAGKPAADAMAGPPRPPAAPEAVSEGSQTYGGLGEQFGAELQAQPPSAPAAPPPQLPAVPQIENMPDANAAAAVAQFRPPALTNPRGTPIAPAAVGASPVSSPAAPSIAAHPQSGQPLNLPSPIELTQRAMKDTQSPKYGFRDPVKQKMAEQQYASHIMDTLLKVTDQHLAQNPHIKTLADADNDPNFGPEFRQVMDAIGRYEAAGQIEKGTLENWQKQRFADVRFGSDKYNPNPTDQVHTDGAGNAWIKNNVTGEYERLGEGKAPPVVKTDELTDAAFGKAPALRSQTENALIAGFKEKLKSEQMQKGTPTDRVQEQWLDDPKNTTARTTDQIARAFQERFHPLQPVQPTIGNAINPATGKTSVYMLDKNTGLPKWTDIRTPGQPFNQERFMREIPEMITAPGFAPIPSGKKTKIMSADALIGDHSSPTPSVSLETLVDLLNSGVEFTPEDRVKLQNYVNSQVVLPPPVR